MKKVIRESAIQKLFQEFVVKTLTPHLSRDGFKWYKSKNNFTKKGDILELNLSIYTVQTPLKIDLENDQSFLLFNLTTSITSPKLDKWLKSKLKRQPSFNHRLKTLECIVPVRLDILSESDFYTPTAAQQFKRNVWYTLTPIKDLNTLTPIDDLPHHTNALLSELETLNDIHKLNNSSTHGYPELLAFAGQLNEAINIYKDLFKQGLKNIETEQDEESKKWKIDSLHTFTKKAKVIAGIDFENPYAPDVKISFSEELKLKLTDTLAYQQFFDIDTSGLINPSFCLNNLGQTLIRHDDDELIFIDANGKKSNAWNLEESFIRDTMKKTIFGSLDAINLFYFRRYIISEEKVYELLISEDPKIHAKAIQEGDFLDFAYDTNEKCLYGLFQLYGQDKTYLNQYNSNFELIHSVEFNEYLSIINLPKRQVMAIDHSTKQAKLYAFSGELYNTYTFSNGNEKVCLSINGEMILSHAYTSVSQFYYVNSKKKKGIRVHPTNIKGYKEKFYSDIHNNFGIRVAKFLKNDTVLVAVGDHGKMAYWNTEDLNRHELIPMEEAFIMFNYHKSSYKNNVREDIYFKPYLGEIDGHKTFINKGFEAYRLSYLPDEDLFVSHHHDDRALFWNSAFTNIDFNYGLNLYFSNNGKYLIEKKIKGNTISFLKKSDTMDESYQYRLFKELDTNNPYQPHYIPPIKTEEPEKTKEVVGKTSKKKSWFIKLFRK